jgi:hypothetical protein
VAAIDAEVGTGGEQHRIGERFGHAHQASICETHGHVGVLLHELQYPLRLVAQRGRHQQTTPTQQRNERRCAASRSGVVPVGSMPNAVSLPRTSGARAAATISRHNARPTRMSLLRSFPGFEG